MLHSMERVNFSGLLGLVDPKDSNFFSKLQNAKSIVGLQLIHKEEAEMKPAVDCLLTDHLFQKQTCLKKKFNINLIVPHGRPDNYFKSESKHIFILTALPRGVGMLCGIVSMASLYSSFIASALS